MCARHTAAAVSILVALAVPMVCVASTISVRISYKIILNPADGTRPTYYHPPTGETRIVDDSTLQEAVDRVNEMLASYWRGYRFEIAEAKTIGGVCIPCVDVSDGPSFWYGKEINWEGAAHYPTFDDEATTDPQYAWNNNAINVYVVDGHNGGECALARDGLETVIFGSCCAWEGFVLLHELGHYLDLQHTHLGQPTCGLPCALCGPGDDGIPDTLLDNSCWTWMDIALANYGAGWADTPQQHAAVDQTYYNIMSYHEPENRNELEDRMTELQLDHTTDIANGTRVHVVSGLTRFVSTSGSASGSGAPTDPHLYFTDAIQAVPIGGGDIVLLRPGSYAESLWISKPVTLRATRQGAARIGQ